VGAVVDAAQDAVDAASGAVPVVKWGHEAFADEVGVGQQGSGDALVAANAMASGSCSASCRRAVAVMARW
jgi:hypothetical protein